MKTNLPQGEWDWGSPSFKALGLHKVQLIYTALSWGLALVITDIDALVLREPFHYMERWPDASFLTTSDHLGNTTGSRDGGLEDSGATSSAFNIGYMFFNVTALPLVKAWRNSMFSFNRWDQGEFNSLVRSGMDLRRREGLSDPRLFRCLGGGVVGGVLPLGLFAGGHHHFVSAMAQRQHVAPYSVHTTFQYGGAPGKRHRLREAMLWEEADPASYYAPAQGVLAYEPDLPASLLHPSGGMTASGHVALMQHQLRQLRAALALAHALGRLLVLPTLACGFDKYWANLNLAGVIPSAHAWAAPIGGACPAWAIGGTCPSTSHSCPLDHMLNPAELKPSPAAYVREWSFLRHPRLPPSFAPTAALRSAVNLDQGAAEMRRLRAAAAARVLIVTNLPRIAEPLWRQGERYRRHGGGGRAFLPDGAAANELLLSPREWRSFKKTFAGLQGGWCCAPAGQKPRAAGFHVMHTV